MDPVRSVRVSTVVPARIDDPKVGGDDDDGDGDDGGIGESEQLSTVVSARIDDHYNYHNQPLS